MLPGLATATPVDARGAAIDSSGNMYIADPLNDVIEKVTSGGTLSIFAGTGRTGVPTAGPATSSDLNHPDGVAVDSSGNVYIADTINDVIEKVTPSGTLSIIAGTPGHHAPPTPGPATSSSLYHPAGVAVDGSGNVYIADTDNEMVEEVTTGGTLSIIAGTGTSGAPTPGPATSSDLSNPSGVAVDSSGNVYIADTNNQVVEKVTPGTPGTLSIAAGTGTSGAPTPGPATSSDLSDPSGVATDSSGDVYIADQANGRIEEVTPSGTLSIIAGTGGQGPPTPGPATSSNLYNPAGVAVDSSGDVYISDGLAGVVAEVASGSLSIAAGLIDYGPPTAGPATSSDLSDPSAVAADRVGDLYVADPLNDVIEKVTSGGTLSIFAGTGRTGVPTAGPATSSDLNHPDGVAVDSSGNVYIADTINDVIEKVTPSGTLSIIAGTPGHHAPPTPGPATSSSLYHPAGVAVDGSGNVYIADTDNEMVEEVTTGGTLSIIAGTGTSGAPTPGPATSSDLSNPSGVAVDSSGNVYIADTNNQVVEKVTPGTPGTLSIAAGTGTSGAPTPGPATSSDLSDPLGVATDSSGDVYIADQANGRIEEVTPSGTLSIIAGTGGQGPPTPGPATSSNLHSPAAVAVDRYGNLFIADLGNSDVEEVFGVASVMLDPTATSLSCAPTMLSAGAATACTATVSDTAASGLMTPTGNVSFVSSPSSGTFLSSSACQLTGTAATGVASCQVSFTPSAPGSYTVTASYGGDSLHHASQQSTTVTEQSPTPSPAHGRASIGQIHVKGTALSVRVTCTGAGSCSVSLKLTVREALKHGKVTAVAASTKLTKRTVSVGSASVVVRGGGSKVVKLSLNGTGRGLLAKHSPLQVKLGVTQARRTVKSSTVTFKAKKH